MSLIGGQLDSITGVNGVRVKAKANNVAEVDFWVSDVYDAERLEIQREWILRSCGLNEDTTMDVTCFVSN